MNRRAQGTDYAKAQGLYVYNSSGSEYHGNSWWWLRTPYSDSDYACGVFHYGNANCSYFVDLTFRGIRPAFKFNPKSEISNPECEHSYNTLVTSPTCTEKGYTTYTCTECGYSYVDDYVNAKGHTYTEVVTAPTCTKDGYTTYTCECGDTYMKNMIPATGHEDNDVDAYCDHCDELLCDHDCHKGGITGFFWKITNFFNKLFRSEKYCECGVAHY